MNKLLAIIIVFYMLIPSCVKDRNCHCTKTHSKTDTTITVEVTVLKSTKSQAKANCASTVRRGNDTVYTTKCKLN